MSLRFPLALGLSLLAAATLPAQTYTWNPASTGNQAWDSAPVWSINGPGGPFGTAFPSGANSSAYLSSSGTVTLTRSGMGLTMKDIRVASAGVTVATGSGGSFLINEGLHTVGGAQTLDLSVGGGNFQFQNTGFGNTTAGKLTLNVSSAVDGGGVIFNTANAFGATPNAEIVLNAASAAGNSGTRLVVGNVTMGAGVSLLMTANASPNNRSTLRGSGAAGWEGAIRLSGTGATQLEAFTGGSFTVNGNIDSGTSATTLVTRGAGAGTLTGVVSGSTAFQKLDAGTWQLTQGNNTFTGNVQIGTGTLRVTKLADGGQDSSLGRASTRIEFGQGSNTDNAAIDYIGTTASSTNRDLNLQAGSGTTSAFTLRANGTTPAATVTFAGNLTHTAVGNTRTLFLDGANTGNNAISGVIAAPASPATNFLNVTKTGAGTWVLGGNNTYNGTTTVSGGTLVVNGGHTGTGAVTVGGGTLGGTGSLNGVVTVNAGGTLRGDSDTGTGSLTLNKDTTIAAGGTAGTRGTLATRLTTDANGEITANSQLVLSGATTDLNFSGLSAGNTFDILLLNDGGLNAGQQYTVTLATAAAGSNIQRDTSGTDAFQPADFNLVSSSGRTFGSASLARSGSSLRLTFSPVPEPASVGVVLLVGALGVAGWRRWRRISTAGRGRGVTIPGSVCAVSGEASMNP